MNDRQGADPRAPGAPSNGATGFADTRPAQPPASTAGLRNMLDWLADSNPLPALVLDAEFRVVAANARYCAVLGVVRDELLGTDGLVSPPDEAGLQAERRMRAMRSRGEVLVDERNVTMRDGRQLWMRLHSRAIEYAGQRMYSVALQDFDEVRTHALPELERGELLRALFADSAQPIAVQDEQYRIVAVNAAFCAFTGYAESELLGRDAVELNAPQTRAHILAARATARMRVKAGLAPGHAQLLDSQQHGVDAAPRLFVCRDGRMLPHTAHVRDVRTVDGRWYAVSVLTDTGTETALRARLRTSLENVRRFLETAPVGLLVRDIDQKVIVANRRFVQLTGWSADELLGKPYDFLRGLDPRMRAAHPETDEEAFPAPGREVRLRMPMMDRSGRRLWTDRTTTRVLDLEGRDALLTVVHDVTAEQQLADDMQRLVLEQGALLRSAAAGVAHVMFGRVVRVNPTLEALLGRQASELQGRPVADLFGRPDLWARLEHDARAVLQAGGTFDCELSLPGPDGRPHLCEARLRLVDASTPDFGLIVTLLDVSALAEARRRFQRFAEVVDAAVLVSDARLARAFYCNDRISEVLGVQRELFERSPGQAFLWVRGEQRAAIVAAFERSAAHAQQELEVRIDHPTRGERQVLVRILPAGPSFDEVYCTAEDVTEVRRLASQQLEDAIRQRDMLVREVHHRIKNNLQGVAGLLQQTALRRPEVRTVLDEVASQIQAIAQIHGIQVEGSVAMRPARMVDVVLAGTGRNFGVAFEIALEEPSALDAWEVPEQESVPLALVINELGTNAIKHRTPGAAVGVRIDAGDASVTMTFWNVGRLVAPIDMTELRGGTSGLSLVKAMLPRRGSRVAFAQVGERVEVSLSLGPPAVVRSRIDDAPAR